MLTQPDRPAGRGMKLQASPVKQLALQHGIPVSQADEPEARWQVSGRCGGRAALLAADADVMVVAAYGLILPAWTPRAAAPRLPQHPRLAAAALARRGA